MPTVGTPRELHGRFKFVVEIDGFEAAFFSKCSALVFEAAMIPYREGGSLIPHKIPGLVTFPPITLERGVSVNADFHAWALEVADASSGTPLGTGQLTPAYKRTLSIIQRDRDNSVILRYDLFGVFPTKLEAGQWDNNANEVTIEMMTLEYDYFQRIVG
jgi:phage tail-like protein